MIRRTYDPEEMNAILNHPEVRPYIGPPADEPADCAFMMTDDNIFLMGEGGGLVFLLEEDGTYDFHVHFLPEFRGKSCIKDGKEAMHWMISRGHMVTGNAPKGHRAARLYSRLIGGRHIGSTEDMEIFTWGC